MPDRVAPRIGGELRLVRVVILRGPDVELEQIAARGIEQLDVPFPIVEAPGVRRQRGDVPGDARSVHAAYCKGGLVVGEVADHAELGPVAGPAGEAVSLFRIDAKGPVILRVTAQGEPPLAALPGDSFDPLHQPLADALVVEGIDDPDAEARVGLSAFASVPDMPDQLFAAEGADMDAVRIADSFRNLRNGFPIEGMRMEEVAACLGNPFEEGGDPGDVGVVEKAHGYLGSAFAHTCPNSSGERGLSKDLGAAPGEAEGSVGSGWLCSPGADEASHLVRTAPCCFSSAARVSWRPAPGTFRISFPRRHLRARAGRPRPVYRGYLPTPGRTPHPGMPGKTSGCSPDRVQRRSISLRVCTCPLALSRQA